MIVEFQSLKYAISFSKIRKEFFTEVKNKNISIFINSSYEKETLYYKLTKTAAKVNKITFDEYIQDKDKFKNIPCLLPCNNQIGVFKVND